VGIFRQARKDESNLKSFGPSKRSRRNERGSTRGLVFVTGFK
jgi:hypothetical protein